MERIKKNFGFGFMRLPTVDGKVELTEAQQMVDAFLEAGFNYFDTAHGYLDGQSETALKTCLTSRYDREKYVLTNKLSDNFFSKQEDILPLFESQLEACGVSYFDFYLMHAQDAKNFEKYKACKAYETVLELKNQGKIRHMGISFHDKAEVLDRILTEYPQIEIVQIQFNYFDYDDPAVESRKCYEICRKHHKPVIVMEPVKGGSLVQLPPEAQAVFDGLQGGSNASYAIRFAAGFEGIVMVLSGMGSMEMLRDNLSYMSDFQPLSQKEMEAVEQVCGVLKKQNRIGCTDCKYCMQVCPQNIQIPGLFACLNAKNIFNSWNSGYYYRLTSAGAKALDCLKCGACEDICPQHLNIRQLLEDVAEAFEKK